MLDTVKRGTIVALTRLGGSRRMAAREVGCSPATITRTAARDPQFAARLAHAESLSDHRALELICRATEQEKYWRAAAWMLERRNPEEFGRRVPHTFTSEQVMQVVARLVGVLLPAVPDERRDEVILEFNDTLAELAPGISQPPGQLAGPGDRDDVALDVTDEGLGLARVEELRSAHWEKTERWLGGLSEQELDQLFSVAAARARERGVELAFDPWANRLFDEIECRTDKREVTFPGGVRRTMESLRAEELAAKAAAASAQHTTTTGNSV